MKKNVITALLFFVMLCLFLASCEEPEVKCVHTEKEWVIATEAGCSAAGLKILQCDKCGEHTKVIPAIGHQWKNASCTEPKTCTRCNKQEGDALGHDYEEKVTQAATCTASGIKTYTCTRCNDSYEDQVERLGHQNTLQSSGLDVCKNCNKQTYTTYSVKALSGIYARLKAPQSAKISSIYAGKTTWENKDAIAVVISLSAQNSYGGMGSAEYVILFDLATGIAISYDLVADMEDKADYYDKMADISSGQSKIDNLNKSNEYLNKSIRALNIRKNKVLNLNVQDLEYIDPIAKEKSGAF